jgi:predicted amidohydrolase
MQAHLVQMDIAWENIPANHEKVRRLLEAVTTHPGDLVVLPEMFDTGFSFNLDRTADRRGDTLAFLQDLARRRQLTVHGARTVIGPDGRGLNRATAIGPRGQILAEYDKIHPFCLGSPSEAERFTAGSRVITYPWTPTDGGPTASVCPAICYDLRFPELFRTGMLAGAEVFAVGSNWPVTREFHRRTLSIARAIENQAFVLSVNRVGRDPSLEYGGGSLAVSPRGEVLGELASDEGVLSVPIDLDDLRRWRAVFPVLKDARLLARPA